MNKDALRYPLLLDIVLCLVTLLLGSFGILVRLTPALSSLSRCSVLALSARLTRALSWRAYRAT
jgi:hypothetical protein